MTPSGTRSTTPRLTVRRFATLLRGQRLLAPGDHVLVAVSGGPDSTALLRLLVDLAPAWSLRISAGHVHHGLRGRESDEDADFVAALCRRWDVPLRIERGRRPAPTGTRKGRSLQEWAREVRYAFLHRTAGELRATSVALAHTADDQAETMLLWMLRGAGATGLAGIPRRRDGRLVRPLLSVRRQDILEFLEATGVPYRSDSSNLSPAYLRNRIRHELLPVLRRFNPAIVELLCRQADLLRADDQCLEQQAADWLRRLEPQDSARLTLRGDEVEALPLALQRRVVRQLLRQRSDGGRWPSFRTVAAVLALVTQGRPGSTLLVPGARVTRDYGTTRIERLAPSEPPPSVPPEGIPLPIPGAVLWPPTEEVIAVQWSEDATACPASPARRAVLDPARFTPELRVRTWRPGDRFQPAGMAGHRKKLQDYFSDLKVPRDRRRRIPLVVAPEGILWVVGYRADQRVRATRSTTRALVVEVRPR